ncbi:hypothetical protein [Shimia sp. SDUM112013]|uniref:hypothetical protein n=1 Tax=Shimia sp. SDUM112013 TaxID=3136160 RepID=UPI0032ECBF06
MKSVFQISRAAVYASVTVASMIAVTSEGVWAMGTSADTGHKDIKVSSDLEGFVAQGDTDPLPAGYVRVYTTADIQAVSGLPKPVQDQAALIGKLVDIAVHDGIHDITGAASQAGVTPAGLDRAAYPESGKRSQSNRILSIGDDTGVRGFFVARIAEDQPDQAVPGVLHCVEKASAVSYRLSYLQAAQPSDLIQIKAKICNK